MMLHLRHHSPFCWHICFLIKDILPYNLNNNLYLVFILLLILWFSFLFQTRILFKQSSECYYDVSPSTSYFFLLSSLFYNKSYSFSSSLHCVVRCSPWHYMYAISILSLSVSFYSTVISISPQGSSYSTPGDYNAPPTSGSTSVIFIYCSRKFYDFASLTSSFLTSSISFFPVQDSPLQPQWAWCSIQGCSMMSHLCQHSSSCCQSSLFYIYSKIFHLNL